MPEGHLYRSMLLDFYGELLTPRQRECYELHYSDDLSLSEIAEACGISRQGAWDNIRRATETLEEIEQKTGLIRRHTEMTERLTRLQQTLSQISEEAAGCGGIENLVREAQAEVMALLKTED